MKEFIKSQKVTYNLMSFTAYKALLMFELLSQGPKSFEQISDYFFNHPYLRERISIDTMRVYINSLKRIGCEIKRVKGEDKISRYVISSHPFELKLSPEQIRVVIRVYKSLVKNIDIKELYSLESFFEKIGNYIKDDEFIADIKKIAMFGETDKELIKDLIDCCDRKDQIIVQYNSPRSGIKDIEIIADKLDISNGKIYLYGTGFEYGQYSKFLLSRIKCIKEIKAEKTLPVSLNYLKVRYELISDNPDLSEDEVVINQNGNKYLVEVNTTNKFLLTQKLLEYGPSCKILEPEDFKAEFVALLKDMKAGYYCG